MSQQIGLKSFDNLLVSEVEITEPVTIASGQGILARGTVLGRITKAGVTAVAGGAGTAGANTGNGTCTPDATTPRLTNCRLGAYKVVFTAATAFGVFDPEGRYLGAGVVGTAFANQIKFNTAAGGTPHIAGDGWVLTVAAGSGSVAKVNSANTDGSEVPYAVLLETTDATSAAAAAPGALSGTFNDAALVFGGTDTITTHRFAMRDVGLFVNTTQHVVNG